MKDQVWLGAGTLTYPEGGGHLWVFLNWALGLRGAGCDVVWLEAVDPSMPEAEFRRLLSLLRARLEPYGFAESVAVCSETEQGLPESFIGETIPLARADEASLLLNIAYLSSESFLARFRRTALLDIDPGLLQGWMSEGTMALSRHDCYFTIGETVGQKDARFPGGGLEWIYTPPCVALEAWPVTPGPSADAPFTTVSHWGTSGEWVTFGNESYQNDKRSGFFPFLELPRHTPIPLELAICLAANERLELAEDEFAESERLKALGWRVIHSQAVSVTPWDYQAYIQRSRGEFGCVKPSCVRLQNAWISDRTICYLASGRPAVIQHTGPSRFLPDAEGLFRFRNMKEAVHALEYVAENYEEQCRQARGLAERHFAASHVVPRLIDRALDQRRSRVFSTASANLDVGTVAAAPVIAVLGYHKIGAPSPDAWDTWYYVSEEIFVQQLRLIREAGWQFIDRETFLRGLAKPASLPPRSALVTFDDGYRSVLSSALPHLRAFDVPAIIFVPTAYVGDASRFDANSCEPVEAICSWDELRELDEAGVSVESHGARHRTFSDLDPAEWDDELMESQRAIETNLGKQSRLFAYPYGDAGADPAAVNAAIEKAGYAGAFLFGGGVQAFPAPDRFRLSRVPMWRDTDLPVALGATSEARAGRETLI